jgi:hypothetical protein
MPPTERLERLISGESVAGGVINSGDLPVGVEPGTKFRTRVTVSGEGVHAEGLYAAS